MHGLTMKIFTGISFFVGVQALACLRKCPIVPEDSLKAELQLWLRPRRAVLLTPRILNNRQDFRLAATRRGAKLPIRPEAKLVCGETALCY